MPLWINDGPYCTYRHCYYSGSVIHLESDTDFLNESIHTRWAFVIVQADEWSRHPRFHYVRYKVSSLICGYVQCALRITVLTLQYSLVGEMRISCTDSQKHPTSEDVFILSVGHVFRKEHIGEYLQPKMMLTHVG